MTAEVRYYGRDDSRMGENGTLRMTVGVGYFGRAAARQEHSASRAALCSLNSSSVEQMYFFVSFMPLW